MARTSIVFGNWKLNPSTLERAKKLYVEVVRRAPRREGVEVVVAPPFPYLAALGAKKRVALGAQDLFWEREGTYTGEVSAPMLASSGVTHVLVGHSERRALGETDEQVALKVEAGLAAGLSTILCVGERERDFTGQYLGTLAAQLAAGLSRAPAAKLGKLIVAYEPVWAISSGDGKGKTATPEDIHEMVIFIRRALTEQFGRARAERIPILYGGSVGERNATELIAESTADGFLVGGASLDATEFGAVIRAVHDART